MRVIVSEQDGGEMSSMMKMWLAGHVVAVTTRGSRTKRRRCMLLVDFDKMRKKDTNIEEWRFVCTYMKYINYI